MSGQRIVINELRAEQPQVPTESWWLDLDRPAFYAIVHARQPMLASKYGSQPVSIIGPRDPGFNERARRAKDHEAAQFDRMVS